MQGRQGTIFTIALFALGIGVIIVIWQTLFQDKIIGPLFLASPMQTVQNFIGVLSQPPVYARLEDTIRLTFAAFFSAILLGSGIGLLIGGISVARASLEPYVVLANSIPRVVFVPFFWALFGVTNNYYFFFGFVSSVIPVIINVIFALKAVDPQLLKVATVFGASKFQMYRKVFVPTVIPSILGAARLSFNLAFGGVIIAEEFAGSFGAGYLAAFYADAFQPIPLYVIVSAIALIGASVNVALLEIEKWYTRWNRG